MTPSAPIDPQAAQQAIDVLQRVQDKVLLEMWTTLMLTGGLAAVAIAQVLQMFRLRRVAAFFIGIYGYAMTWVPAQAALYIGYFTMVLCVVLIVRETMSAPPTVSSPRKAA